VPTGGRGDGDGNVWPVGGFDPVITPDGRYVAFIGFTNLLPAGVGFGDVHDEIV
jgi:hypothetical protein